MYERLGRQARTQPVEAQNLGVEELCKDQPWPGPDRDRIAHRLISFSAWTDTRRRKRAQEGRSNPPLRPASTRRWSGAPGATLCMKQIPPMIRSGKRFAKPV